MHFAEVQRCRLVAGVRRCWCAEVMQVRQQQNRGAGGQMCRGVGGAEGGAVGGAVGGAAGGAGGAGGARGAGGAGADMEVQRWSRGAEVLRYRSVDMEVRAGAEVQMWRSVVLKMSRGGAKVQSRG